MKTWDAVILGGGIIGLSLAWELSKHGAQVIVVERGEPGREASHAAAGMLAPHDPHMPAALEELAAASANLYPEFVHELENESGLPVDLRREGTILFLPGEEQLPPASARLSPAEIKQLEPGLEAPPFPAAVLEEQSVDPRALMAALQEAARHRTIEVSSGLPATGLEMEKGRATGVKTARTRFLGGAVINCCGAWAGQVAPVSLPVRPVKGQMLSVVEPRSRTGGNRIALRHVVRAPEVYLVPRSDGRVLIGSTIEEAGFDQRVDVQTIQRLHDAGARLLPRLAQGRMLECWAGLRPGTPDELPVLGGTKIPGYYVASGHFRNGILLAPITAHLMAQVVRGAPPGIEISAFAPQRFRA